MAIDGLWKGSIMAAWVMETEHSLTCPPWRRDSGLKPRQIEAAAPVCRINSQVQLDDCCCVCCVKRDDTLRPYKVAAPAYAPQQISLASRRTLRSSEKNVVVALPPTALLPLCACAGPSSGP